MHVIDTSLDIAVSSTLNVEDLVAYGGYISLADDSFIDSPIWI